MLKPAIAALAVLAATGATQACLPLANSITVTIDVHDVGLGTIENRCVIGGATLCYKSSTSITTMNLAVLFLKPRTTYGVNFTSDGAGFDNSIAFTTNWLGAATFFDNGTIGDSTGNPTISIYINDSETGAPFEMDPEEIRAVTGVWF